MSKTTTKRRLAVHLDVDVGILDVLVAMNDEKSALIEPRRIVGRHVALLSYAM